MRRGLVAHSARHKAVSCGTGSPALSEISDLDGGARDTEGFKQLLLAAQRWFGASVMAVEEYERLKALDATEAVQTGTKKEDG